MSRLRSRIRRPSLPTTIAMTALVAAIAVPAYGDDVAHMAMRFTSADGRRIARVIPPKSLTGRQIRMSTLGKVPRATLADAAASAGKAGTAKTANAADTANTAATATRALDADKLGGKDASAYAPSSLVRRIAARMSFGDDVPLVTNGPVSLRAQCVASDPTTTPANMSVVRVYATTTEPNAFLHGKDDLTGDTTTPYLQPGNPPGKSRVLAVEQSSSAPSPVVAKDLVGGFVAARSGAVISVDGPGAVVALHAFGSDCAVLAKASVDTVS